MLQCSWIKYLHSIQFEQSFLALNSCWLLISLQVIVIINKAFSKANRSFGDKDIARGWYASVPCLSIFTPNVAWLWSKQLCTYSKSINKHRVQAPHTSSCCLFVVSSTFNQNLQSKSKYLSKSTTKILLAEIVYPPTEEQKQKILYIGFRFYTITNFINLTIINLMKTISIQFSVEPS